MIEPHLKVFLNRSELVREDGSIEIFLEGKKNVEIQEKCNHVTVVLRGGFLKNVILEVIHPSSETVLGQISEQHITHLKNLVGSITSEVGRALVGLTVLQLCIKSIDSSLNIRLHKDFWQTGISMRSLDGNFITPTLREFDLLKLNKDGFMMTRSLAENYPYSKFYKANIRGAKSEWLEIVDALETGTLEPLPALYFVITQLVHHAGRFQDLVQEVLNLKDQFVNKNAQLTQKIVLQLLEQHIQKSDYAARIMEIAMHALMQAMQDVSVTMSGTLVTLSQMRSANKKHGNVADIELAWQGQIIEAWDAKYGKAYLRDELEELSDKLEKNPSVQIAGFVSSEHIIKNQEITTRVADLEALHGIDIYLFRLDEWVAVVFQRAQDQGITEDTVARAWLTAYVESLSQKRIDVAPIDEPCFYWLELLGHILKAQL
jgi:hypothetical protein